MSGIKVSGQMSPMFGRVYIRRRILTGMCAPDSQVWWRVCDDVGVPLM